MNGGQPEVIAGAFKVDSFDDLGNPIEIDNPVYLTAVSDIATATATIEAATQGMIDLVQLRSDIT